VKPNKKKVSHSPISQFIKWPKFVLGGLFILVGIGAILWICISIGTNPATRLALDSSLSNQEDGPSFVMALLVEFGIILPILVIAAGIAVILLGIRIFSGNITVARWAQVILFWLAIGAIIIDVLNIIQLITYNNKPGATEGTIINQSQFLQLLGLFLLSLFFGACSLWLKRNIKHLFHGEEKLKDAEVRFAWNLLIPTLAILILVAGRPLEQTFIRSLTDKRFAGQDVPNFVGLKNYRDLLGFRFDVVDCRLDEESGDCALNPNGSVKWETIDRELLTKGFRSVWNIKIPFANKATALSISGLDSDFIKSIWTTLIFTVISVSLELIVGLFIALAVNSHFKGRGVMRTVMLVPWAIPTAISAILWENMLKSTSSGVINRILMDLHIIDEPQAWLAMKALQIPSAIIVDVWKTAPFVALLLLAGLQIISKDLYEAASVDGASRYQKFFSITLPLLRPTIAVALVFRTLDALRVFDLFNVLFARQQLTMATYNYEMLVGSQKDGYASAISIIIFILISIFAFIYVKMLNVETE
jgi:trehalose/maltose transport system permease protein